MKTVMSSELIRNEDNDTLKARKRTSVSRSTVLNLGKDNPRVVAVPISRWKIGNRMPRKRRQSNYFPSSPKVLALLLKCFPLDGGNICVHHGDFATAFRVAAGTGTRKGEAEVCGTPVRWIAYALRCSFGRNIRRSGDEVESGVDDAHTSCGITQLRSLDDVLHERWRRYVEIPD